MDDSYNPELMGEALYAELDRESLQSDNNPSYQNTAYSASGEVSLLAGLEREMCE